MGCSSRDRLYAFFVTGWKIFDYGWKIGWEISRFEAYLPAFIVFVVRELRRFWEIWQIFSCAELLCVVVSASVWCRFICVPNDILGIIAWVLFQILLKKPSYSSSNIFQIPFLRPPSLTINLRSESCLRYRCTWRREMPMFSDICVALI